MGVYSRLIDNLMKMKGPTLALIASSTITAQVLIVMYWKVSRARKEIREQPWYKEAVDLFVNYPDAKQLLGEPIDAQGASMMRFMDTYIEDNVAKVAVAMHGPKTKGMLYIHANRKHPQHQFRIDHLEIGIYKNSRFFTWTPPERWTFYDKRMQR